MPRVPVHDLESAPDASRDLLKGLREKHGKILNIHGEMAHAPAVLDLYVSAEGAIAERSSLDVATRKAIHLAVSTVNGCGYCQSAYTVGCKRAGFDEDQTVAIRERREAEFDGKLATLLDVTREVAANQGYVDDSTWQAALDAGWSDHQILEAFADTIRATITNYFNHLVGTDLDLPAAPGLEER